MERPTQLQKRKHGDPYPLDERLLRRRNITDQGCWEYLGAKNPRGYGNFSMGSAANGTRKVRKAHAVAYELWVGPVPDGLEIDHTCRNTSCFNPEHLEAVSHQENIQRAYPIGSLFECGHPITVENICAGKNTRRCRTCKNASKRVRMAKYRADRS